jgi:monoamine oxidase
MANDKLNIAIAGAGIAGLINGLVLQRAGHSVYIYEARSRTGGRIQSINLEGMVVECGPEFIHGKLKETIGLLKKYNIPFDPIDGKMYAAKGDKLRESDYMTEGWDLLIEKMKSLEKDIPLREFLENNFPGDQYNELRKSAMGFAEGFDLADPETASTQALILEWEHEESGQFRIPAGYGTLIHSLENEFKAGGGKIFLNHPLETVDWNSGKIILGVKGKLKFSMDRLVICLPLSILNSASPTEESIHFFPAIDERITELNQIGFGSVIKIIMIWEKAFWKNLIPEAQFIFSDQFIPTWWTQYPLNLPMLTGWFGGPRALKFANESDGFFRDKAIESLASIFSLPLQGIKTGLKECRIFNWKNEPWSRGAYSYSKVGYGKAKAAFRKPLLNRVYFSGEAYYEGPYPGTVEAAVVNGLETAELLLREL